MCVYDSLINAYFLENVIHSEHKYLLQQLNIYLFTYVYVIYFILFTLITVKRSWTKRTDDNIHYTILYLFTTIFTLIMSGSSGNNQPQTTPVATPGIDVTEVPASLRPITRYVKVADDYVARDIAIYYWCKLLYYYCLCVVSRAKKTFWGDSGTFAALGYAQA